VSIAVERPPSNVSRERRVLVLGDDTRNFLTVVRSLGRRNITVDVVPFNFASPALKSRYIRAIHHLPPYVGDGADWVTAARTLIGEKRFDLVLPCDDRSILPFHAHREKFADLTILAIPDPRGIDVLFDKEKTKALAASLAVNLAKTSSLQGDATQEGIIRVLGAPVVVKPKHSYRIEKLDRRAAVRIVGTSAELSAAIAEIGAEECYVEEFFQGTGVGVSVLASGGDILVAFQHHRVHEYGGASSYRVSASLSADLTEVCAKMLAALKYTGVVMFEFRRNFATNDWILLEVNARPWGSLPLPVSLGVDFPYLWYRLLVDGKQSAQPVYRSGVYGRNLILDVHYINRVVAKAQGVRARFSAALAWLRGFDHLLTGRERNDTIVADDVSPGLAELREFAVWLAGRVADCLPLAHRIRRFAARSRLRSAIKASNNPVSIVFVCYGNICRSPFAARQLADKLATRQPGVRVSSAGTYAVSGRSAPPNAIAAAHRFAVDLTPHRSRYLTDEMARTASVILTFDQSNVDALRDRFSLQACPIILLGRLADRSVASNEIADPYGADESEHERIYRQIEAAVDTLLTDILRKVR
jgi:protein-tyrosine-phosphatase/predicted ATP-grasp superfamily ATP-dependent carboligase